MDFLDCKVCHVPYDEEEHRPRHAPCGHEYCTMCIKALIKASIFMCPKCRQKNKVDAAEDMPVNFGLIDVVRAFKTKSIPLAKETESRLPRATNDEVCNMHGKSLGHWCRKCQLWLCNECLEHHTSSLGCSTEVATKIMDEMKEKNSKDTDVLLSIFEDDTKFVSSKIQELKDNRKEISDKRQELLERSEKYGEEVIMLTNVLEQGNLQKEKLLDSKRDLNAADSPHSVSDKLKDWTQRKQMLRNWSVKNLGTDTLFGLLKAFEEEKVVYAEKLINNEIRHAKLSKHDQNIDVHPFLKQTVSDGSVCMPFDRLQKMISEAPLVFLELTLGLTVKGRVLIRLNKELPNNREYVVHIVTGQTGPTLVGIALSNSNKNYGLYSNALPFSETKFTPDSNGSSIPKRGDVICFLGNMYFQQILFHVAMSPTNHTYGSGFCVFGHVEEGMDVIQECYENSSSTVVISDCGLAIEHE
ncbi:unnamed protein product [Meganyctiphanes norvegica]|uniref:RING-type domain-containing protein n=1 Tax=Meganyctiphanes norvegica TaxID=48144 RepID=A0AAV2QYZ3_MEGNR